MRLVRNIGVMAHIDAGKTTLTERMLYLSGVIRSMGEVHDGDTTMDYMHLERERGITINSAAISFRWNLSRVDNIPQKDNINNNPYHHFNLIDTPGHVDFTIEVERSLRVLDGAVAVFDAVAGVQPQSRTVWKQATKYQVPCIAFINKMDRDGASWKGSVQSIKDELGVRPLVTQYPLYGNVLDSKFVKGLGGGDNKFVGTVDLLSMRSSVWNIDPTLGNYGKEFISDKYSKETFGNEYDQILQQRQMLFENIADLDDSFAEAFLEREHDIEENEIRQALRRITLQQPKTKAVPILFGAAFKNKGVQQVMDAAIDYLPSPVERHPNFFTGGDDNDMQRLYPVPLKSAFAFKVQHDPLRGPLVYLRIYEGALRPKDVLWNITQDTRERATTLLFPAAQSFKQVDDNAVLGPGNIIVVAGFKNVKTGDILSSERNLLSGTAPLNQKKDKDASKKKAKGKKGQASSQTEVSTKIDIPDHLKPITIPPPVFNAALELTSATEEKELQEALKILTRDDPSLQMRQDDETGQLVLSGMGELHLDVAKEKLKRDFKLKVALDKVRVAYRETIASENVKGVGDVDRTLGESIQKAKIVVHLKPHPNGVMSDSEIIIVDESLNENDEDGDSDDEKEKQKKQKQGKGNQIDQKKPKESGISLPIKEALMKSLQASLSRGPLLGYPVQGVQLTVKISECTLGTHSTEAAVGLAAASAMNDALRNGDPILLEPVVDLEVSVSEAYVGNVLSDINGNRRGTVLEVGRKISEDGLESTNEKAPVIIKAMVPLERMIGYSTSLRSMTSGEGDFSMKFSTFQEVHVSNIQN